MTTTVPRAELHAIAMRHNDEDVDLDHSPSIEWVRRNAAGLRDLGDEASIAEAYDLDALADRYEQKENDSWA